jgi:uncharacterized membrane protein YkgB
MKNWRMTVVVVVVAGLAGCARYEYDVIKPVISPGRVGEKDDVVIDGEVVRYRIRTVDGRLVVRDFALLAPGVQGEAAKFLSAKRAAVARRETRFGVKLAALP